MNGLRTAAACHGPPTSVRHRGPVPARCPRIPGTSHLGLVNREYCQAAVSVVKSPPTLTIAPRFAVNLRDQFQCSIHVDNCGKVRERTDVKRRRQNAQSSLSQIRFKRSICWEFGRMFDAPDHPARSVNARFH